MIFIEMNLIYKQWPKKFICCLDMSLLKFGISELRIPSCMQNIHNFMVKVKLKFLVACMHVHDI